MYHRIAKHRHIALLVASTALLAFALPKQAVGEEPHPDGLTAKQIVKRGAAAITLDSELDMTIMAPLFKELT